MEFKNKIAIVTGAAAGIGKAVAMQLAAGGAAVIMTDINENNLQQAAEDIAAKGGKAVPCVCDVQDEEKVYALVRRVLADFGRVDILINNAGVYDEAIPFEQSESSVWKRKIDINILGTMYFTHAVLDSMIEKRYGRIVNIGSVAGVYGIKYFVDYSMTKGAVIAFTKALAKHVGDKGITVNCVSPGNIHPEDEENQYGHMSFLGRCGSPDECADAICYLASDRASFISGQNLLVDGCRKVM